MTGPFGPSNLYFALLPCISFTPPFHSSCPTSSPGCKYLSVYCCSICSTIFSAAFPFSPTTIGLSPEQHPRPGGRMTESLSSIVPPFPELSYQDFIPSVQHRKPVRENSSVLSYVLGSSELGLQWGAMYPVSISKTSPKGDSVREGAIFGNRQPVVHRPAELIPELPVVV